MKILVTGGAGFIGSAVARYLVAQGAEVVNVDCLTYAGNLENLRDIEDNPGYCLEQVNICDRQRLQQVFTDHRPEGVMHLAAESHVDRSIDGPDAFIQTNIVGTYTLLAVALAYFEQLDEQKRDRFRFHHVSTDEVYGSLGATGLFEETTPYDPSSPYSASKAASDHLVRAWQRTYGLPTVVTNCSNNYGPYQFPEKMIPVMILNGLAGVPLPVYGTGENVRDWLYVEDHAEALYTVFCRGQIGETYNIGGLCQKTNLEVVRAVCNILDELRPESKHRPHESLITFVEDRPGHDLRYAIDCRKIQSSLGWSPRHTFESGLRATVEWYLANGDWCDRIRNRGYAGERLGTRGSP